MAKEKEKKGKQSEKQESRVAQVARHSAKERPRLRSRFEKEIAPALMKELDLGNTMAVPRLHKIVVNMGVGEATQNAKILDPAVNELGQITGQKPVVTRAKKSIAAFKVREGMPIGAMVTLRGDRMYEFMDRLVSVVLPRVRDFRGVSTKSFDGRGNYTLGLHDQAQMHFRDRTWPVVAPVAVDRRNVPDRLGDRLREVIGVCDLLVVVRFSLGNS